ncbi:MAG: VWA domain-containing protein [SAR324 cluster bacterium]|nr:VWA domain-containing protein [SAR324 cluster bacterium]
MLTMDNGLLAGWIALLLASLFYIGLLYRKRQYRHRYALIRLAFLFGLLFFFRPLPEYSSEEKQDLFVLIDTSKSMRLYLQDPSDYDEVQNILPPSLLQSIESRYPAYEKHFFDLFQQPQPLNKFEETRILKWRLQSPILSGILDFLERARPPENSRLLLISDGHDTEFEDIPQPLRAQLKKTGTVLDTLVVQNSAAGHDVAIEQVSNPRVVFTKSPVSLQVTLHSNLKSSHSSNLLLTDGQSILHKKTVEFPEGEHSVSTDLSWIPQNPGNLLLFLRLAPLENEQNLHNNITYVPITVRNQRLKVLHIAGRPSWDVVHLRSFLKSIPALDLIAFYILRDPFRDAQTVPEHELALIQFPVKVLFQVELFKFDTVIFHNFAIASYLSNPEYQKSFQKYLSSGKKIVVVGGEQTVGQKKYQQLFLKKGTDPFKFEFHDLLPGDSLQSRQLSQSYLHQQATFPSASSAAPVRELIQRSFYDLGQVDWIMSSELWKTSHRTEPGQIGQNGEFAAFWQTLLYQSEYDKTNVFRDFQKILPYTTDNPIEGVVQMPFQSRDSLNKLKLQLVDQLLNIVVWEKPILVGDEPAAVKLPSLSPSLYEMRLTCNCTEMSDVVQKITVVDEWLELRRNKPRMRWLQQLAEMMGGESIEYFN